jgi:hypothetical protein
MKWFMENRKKLVSIVILSASAGVGIASLAECGPAEKALRWSVEILNPFGEDSDSE